MKKGETHGANTAVRCESTRANVVTVADMVRAVKRPKCLIFF
jgi:hypothetical protein